MEILHVRNWERWQSYRSDRNQPPWIKLHRKLLRKPKWLKLSDQAKAHLISIWVLAADEKGVIPDDPELIQRLAYLDQAPDLKQLIDLGFLERRHDDVNVASQLSQDDANMTRQTRLDKTRSDQTRSDQTRPEEKEVIASAMDAWNEMASRSGLTVIQRMSEPRKASLRKRLKECGGIDGWRTACEKVSESSFLTGDGDRGWTADFDWVIKEANFTKLMEGNYERGEVKSKNQRALEQAIRESNYE